MFYSGTARPSTLCPFVPVFQYTASFSRLIAVKLTSSAMAPRSTTPIAEMNSASVARRLKGQGIAGLALGMGFGGSYASIDIVYDSCLLTQSKVRMKYVKRHDVNAIRRLQMGNRKRLCHVDDTRIVDMVGLLSKSAGEADILWWSDWYESMIVSTAFGARTEVLGMSLRRPANEMEGNPLAEPDLGRKQECQILS